ncbi:hypothetical protein [Azotobacter beijerinckii]|uniref:Uncharacterized protein n=2 Tax=Azotobacter beijerinckii TaxID=170623 RepID=A0A1I4D1X0_9GAMM|nr:hypothetical protein [Azotobacter beijerinckii]SFB28588.1 hypothetical protein SAMN04244571_02091 [Azotobacter beijerinckii]SFK86729.1 hypothetical protein SAMN04244574_02154 [Azotobacter beijerinckii]
MASPDLLASHRMAPPVNWTWQYLRLGLHRAPSRRAASPVWNVVTDATRVKDHSNIMRKLLHMFLRQLSLDLPR